MKLSGDYVVQGLNSFTFLLKINNEIKNTGENYIVLGFMICTLYQIWSDKIEDNVMGGVYKMYEEEDISGDLWGDDTEETTTWKT
jgi:hypothetical protein